MPQQIEVPGLGVIEFPDGMNDAQIADAIRNNQSVAARPSPAFAPGMHPLQIPRDIGRGFVKGLHDIPAGGAEMLTGGLEALAPAGSWFENYMRGEAERVRGINLEAEEAYKKAAGPTSDIGRIAGGAIAAAPIAAAMPGAAAASLPARMTSGAASGAVTTALQPGSKAEDIPFGAVGGAVAPWAASVVSPTLSPQIKSLMGEKVKLTPGQLLGPTASRVEQGAESIPFLGDVIKSARRSGIESFSNAAINRSLAPIGVRLPSDIKAGREALNYAHDKISSQYDALLPRLQVSADPPFVTNLQSMVAASANLEPAYEKVFRANLQDKVLRRFAPGGGMTGDDFKKIEADLGQLTKNYSSSSMAGERELGGAFRQLQAELRDLLMRSNPNHAQMLGRINSAFANLVRVETAGARIGAEEGVFTPAQLLSAVRSGDPTTRKNAFARGDALMQDLADMGKTVLGSKVPDSGTPFRSMVGLAGLGGAAYLDPTLAAGLGGAALGYSPPGRAFMEYLLARRPPGAAQAASVLRLPVAAPLGGLLAQYAAQP